MYDDGSVLAAQGEILALLSFPLVPPPTFPSLLAHLPHPYSPPRCPLPAVPSPLCAPSISPSHCASISPSHCAYSCRLCAQVYSRLETTVGLPIEYGIVTTASILGGLTVYQENGALMWGDRLALGMGMGCIVLGIAITLLSQQGGEAAAAAAAAAAAGASWPPAPPPLGGGKGGSQKHTANKRSRRRSTLGLHASSRTTSARRKSMTAMRHVSRSSLAISFPGAIVSSSEWNHAERMESCSGRMEQAGHAPSGAPFVAPRPDSPGSAKRSLQTVAPCCEL
jgi:hypothetical protein